MINPMMLMQLVGQLRNSQNPEMMLQQMGQNDPMVQRAIQMMQGRTDEEKKQVVMNVCKERGIDFGAVSNVLKQFGINI